MAEEALHLPVVLAADDHFDHLLNVGQSIHVDDFVGTVVCVGCGVIAKAPEASSSLPPRVY